MNYFLLFMVISGCFFLQQINTRSGRTQVTSEEQEPMQMSILPYLEMGVILDSIN